MGNWNNSRPWKFYYAQVDKILSLLERQFKEGELELDTYLRVCEQLGEQQAFFIHDLLTDRWDGMSGSYFGKDMSSLGTLLDIWEIEDKRTIVYFIKHIEAYKMQKINKEQEQKRKARERSSKAGVKTPIRKR